MKEYMVIEREWGIRVDSDGSITPEIDIYLHEVPEEEEDYD